ncbi:sensor histidine kinase [Limnohabitans sp.]|uniref:sensor histidine kinase n=1 Tax=Limnohabitans sp. TaxID=1907725 RepID=UPI0035B10B85
MKHVCLIPADQVRSLLQRLAIVWAVALLISLAQWASHSQGRLDQSLVYSYAISTLIWAFTDLPRFVLRRWLGAAPPTYWPPAGRAALMLLIGILLGYALGTWIGDLYAGHSTWDLLVLNRQRFVGLLVSSVAISAAFIGFFYQRGKTEALQRQASEAQLMLLQSQLEPHMLFNTLAHVRALVQTEPARALTMLDHLDDYLRASLQATRQPWQTLAQELARLDDYLSLMAIRLGPRLRFEWVLPPDLGAQPVPSFILQPLVENAIRHGIEPSVQGGQIHIAAERDGDHLHIRVRNTGAPLPKPMPEGYGLTHVRERLRSLMGAHAKMTLYTASDGSTCAHLQWPLRPAP